MTTKRDRSEPVCGQVARHTVAGFTVGVFDLPAGYRMGLHEHRRSGLVLPLRGLYRARIGDRDLEAGDDRIVVLPAGAPHRETAGAGGSHCLLVLPGRIHSEAHDVDLDVPRAMARPDLARLGRVLYAELRQLDTAARMVAESLLLDLFASRPPGATSPPSGSPGWMDRVLDLVRDRYTESLGHEEIAAEAGVSREHLARTFRRLHGLPLGAYVRRLRVFEAARWLREGEAPIARVAARCGFADHSHLTRTFRRHFELTPTEYRSRVRVAGRRGR